MTQEHEARWEPRLLVLLARADGTKAYILARNAQEESWEGAYPEYQDMRRRVTFHEFEFRYLPTVELAFDEDHWTRPSRELNALASELSGEPLAGDVFLWGPKIEALYIEDGQPAVELP